MKMKNPLLVIMVSLLVWSCKMNNNVAYMQNIEKIAKEVSLRNVQATIQPDDQLLIYITAKDMSIVAPFNQSMTKDYTARVSYSQPNSNLINSGITPWEGVSYQVYPEGYIDFPILGKIQTSGKTIEDLKNELVSRLKKYIINPTVSIRYGNYRITVLGEVNKPGEYHIPNEKTTLLEAIGMAGDLTIYGKRDGVIVVRIQDGATTQTVINLTDANFINSPYFYLKQNDVVYVTPNKTKTNSALFGPQTGVYISIASIVVTILALVFKK